MLLTSIIWRFIEGSLYETISCCMLYILGPLRLFWVKSLATYLPAKILKYVMTAHADHAAFMAVVYSVLLAEHFENISTVIRTVTIGVLVLMCLLFIIPLPVLHWLPYFFWHKKKCCLRCLYYLIWFMMIVMSGVMLYFYIMLLRNEKDDEGLVCVAGFVQALWVLAFSEVPVYYEKLSQRKIAFLYGSAGLVLMNSAALMTELIMKAVCGVRLVGDLRVIVFPSEWLFTVSLLILSIFASRKTVNTESSQMASDYNGTPGTKHTSIDMNQTTGESHEMETLRKVAGNSEEHQEEEIN